MCLCVQGRIQDFMRGGAKYNSGSLKQGAWGAVLPEAIGFFCIKNLPNAK